MKDKIEITLAKKLQKNSILLILLASFLAILGAMKFQGSPFIQFQILIILIGLYFIWAFLYHFFDKSLSLEIMLEYFLTALLAVVVAYGILL